MMAGYAIANPPYELPPFLKGRRKETEKGLKEIG